MTVKAIVIINEDKVRFPGEKKPYLTMETGILVLPKKHSQTWSEGYDVLRQAIEDEKLEIPTGTPTYIAAYFGPFTRNKNLDVA